MTSTAASCAEAAGRDLTYASWYWYEVALYQDKLTEDHIQRGPDVRLICEGINEGLEVLALLFLGDIPFGEPFFYLWEGQSELLKLVARSGNTNKGFVYRQSKTGAAWEGVEKVRETSESY